jgi:hypothetical protein
VGAPGVCIDPMIAPATTWSAMIIIDFIAGGHQGSPLRCDEIDDPNR